MFYLLSCNYAKSSIIDHNLSTDSLADATNLAILRKIALGEKILHLKLAQYTHGQAEAKLNERSGLEIDIWHSFCIIAANEQM